ncbi:MAG TPA: 2-enoate reductase [Clostridiales bacterium]|jgi:2-enoate reductase|nr:FAD-dependent oxidoreductase [Bacillota bacterium]MDY5586531.1 FAD-dependent oxidoreductase [Oscillospiraceae bacterium]MED9854968.1 FAD-dependent oxidoreductase [Oscillospiraceae bacterium]HCY78266.1 2-enoate reductase [Clostridiales bacterium]
MNSKYNALFTPWKIGNVEIPNRIVQCSMGGTSLFGWMEPSHLDKEAAYFLLNRAQDGVGLILPGMQCIKDPIGGRWLYQNNKMFKDLKEYMVEFHKTGSKLFIQLAAGMGRSMAITKPMVALLKHPILGKLASPVADLDYITASASATPNRWYDEIKSRPMTIKEIHDQVEAFAKTSKKLMDAGVDGVEIHAVHEGYLLDQFTISNMNYRTDEYGGSFENRFRFPVEIVQAIKAACGDDFPVSLRYSVVSKTKDWGKGAMPYEKDFKEFGRDMEESEKAIKYLADAGYDMFNCDNGTYDAWYWAHPPQYMPDNCNLEYVEHIKKFTDKPVVCAGRMDPVKAAEEIEAGKLDAVAIARQNLVDHDWIHKIKEGHEDEIKPCIRCHNGCFNMAKFAGTPNVQHFNDSMHLARCALNPTTMQHTRYKIVPTKNPKKVAIIGGGIGGMECALVLKQRGHIPTIFEKTDELGGLFLTASAMTFKENDKELIRWYKNEIEKQGIDVRFNTEINDLGVLRGYDDIIVASGSVPRMMPSIKGFDKALTFTQVLKDKVDVGDKVLFIGGGQSSCEAAYDMLLNFGKHPIIVEYAGDLVAAQATCLANTSFLRDAMEYHKVPVYLHSTVTEITDKGCTVKNVETGETTFVECDSVVNGIGFVPTPVGGKDNKKAYRVGDCVAIGNLRTVIWRAWDVCMKI